MKYVDLQVSVKIYVEGNRPGIEDVELNSVAFKHMQMYSFHTTLSDSVLKELVGNYPEISGVIYEPQKPVHPHVVREVSQN